MKKAFTMIELLFVIVIIGILSAIAIPKFTSIKKNAEIASGKADIAAIRAAIMSERQTQLVRGESSYMPILSKDNVTLFTGTGTIPAGTDDDNRTLLLYGIVASSDGWTAFGATYLLYDYNVTGTATRFTYTPADGKFSCVADQGYCNALVK